MGKINYASSHYTKLIRATVPIADENSKLYYVLLLSFDVTADNFHEIIMKRVIPLIRKNTGIFFKKSP